MNEFEREYKLVKANTEDYIMRNSGVIDFDEIEFDLSKVDAQHVGQFKGEKIIDGKIDMYIIDLEKIGVETATYGIRLQGDENDVYLVSKDTNNVYYKKTPRFEIYDLIPGKKLYIRVKGVNNKQGKFSKIFSVKLGK